MSRKWRLPQHLEGKLWIHKTHRFPNWKRNRECFCVVLKDVLYCHSSETAYRRGEDEIHKILLEQVGGIRDCQAQGHENWAFKIKFEDGREQDFSAETKTEMERWVVNLLYAKEFWAHKKEVSIQEEHSEESWVILPSDVEEKNIPVEAVGPLSTTPSAPEVQVMRCDGRVQSVSLPPVFKAKELFASLNVKPGCFSRELWVVDDSGTETKLEKNMNIDVSDTGYQFYLLERDYKLLVVRFEDHTFQVHPALVNIKASEVSRLPLFAKKLRELECTNPGLFLVYESGTEVLFRSDEEPLSLFWENRNGAWSKKSNQRGTFLLRDKALIIEGPKSFSPTWEHVQRENIHKVTRERNEKKALKTAERKRCARRYPSFENRDTLPRTAVGSSLEFSDEHFSSDDSLEFVRNTIERDDDGISQDRASEGSRSSSGDFVVLSGNQEYPSDGEASRDMTDMVREGSQSSSGDFAVSSSGNQEYRSDGEASRDRADVLEGSQSSSGDFVVSSGNQEYRSDGEASGDMTDVVLEGSQSSSGDFAVSSGNQEYPSDGEASGDMTDVVLEGSQSSSGDFAVSSGNQKYPSDGEVSGDMTDVVLEGSQSSSGDFVVSSENQEYRSDGEASRNMTDVVLKGSQSSFGDLTVSSGNQKHSSDGEASRDMTDVELQSSQSSSGNQEYSSEGKASRDITGVVLEDSQSLSEDFAGSSGNQKHSSDGESSRDVTDVVLEGLQSSFGNFAVASGNQKHSCDGEASRDMTDVVLEGSQSSSGDFAVSSGIRKHSSDGEASRAKADVELEGSQSSPRNFTDSCENQKYLSEGTKCSSRDKTDVVLTGSEGIPTVSSKDPKDSSGNQEHSSAVKVDSSRDMTVVMDDSQSSPGNLKDSSSEPCSQEHSSAIIVDLSGDMTVVMEDSQSSPGNLKDSSSEPCSARVDNGDLSMLDGGSSHVKASLENEDVNSSKTTKASVSGCNTEVNGGVDYGCRDAMSDTKHVKNGDIALDEHGHTGNYFADLQTKGFREVSLVRDYLEPIDEGKNASVDDIETIRAEREQASISPSCSEQNLGESENSLDLNRDSNENRSLHQCSFYKVVSPHMLKIVLRMCEGSSQEEEVATTNELSSICLSGVHLNWVNGSWNVVDKNGMGEGRGVEPLEGERFHLKYGVTAVFQKQLRMWRILYSNESDRKQELETECSLEDNLTSSLSVSPCPGTPDSATFDVREPQPTISGPGGFVVSEDEGQLQSCDSISQVEKELRHVVVEIFKHTKTRTHSALDSSKYEVVEDIICRQLCSALEKLMLSRFSRKLFYRHNLLDVLKEFQGTSNEVMAIVTRLSKLRLGSDRLTLRFFVCECLNMQKDTLAVWMEHVLEGKKHLEKYYENDSYILHLLPEARRNIVSELNRLSNLHFRLYFPDKFLRDISRRTEATFAFE